MQTRDSNLVSHVYGIAGLVPGVISLIASYRTGATWSEMLLLGAGWITAGVFAAMIFRCFGLLTSAYEELGRLDEINHDLKRELESRNKVLDLLAAGQLGKTGTPRATQDQPPAEQE